MPPYGTGGGRLPSPPKGATLAASTELISEPSIANPLIVPLAR